MTTHTRSAFFKLLCAAAMLCAATSRARADIKARWRTDAKPGYEVTLYLKGSAQRRETKPTQPGGLPWAFVIDCARHRVIWLDPVNRRYNAIEGGVPAAAAVSAFNEQQFPPYDTSKLKGTVTETTAVTDTGERREMFGFTARHLKTVTTWAVAPDSCDTSAARIETDGWYIDLLYGVDCSPDLSGATPRIFIDFAGEKCLDGRLRHRHAFRRRFVGDARLGFALSETMRTYGERGLVSTAKQEVFELSTAPLDDALFSVPAGYTLYEPRERDKQSVLARALSIFR